MNLEQVEVISGKIQVALQTIRQLRQDKIELAESKEQLILKVEELENEKSSLTSELSELRGVLSDREEKMSVASEKLQNVMSSLEEELGLSLSEASSEGEGSALTDSEEAVGDATVDEEYEYVEYYEENSEDEAAAATEDGVETAQLETFGDMEQSPIQY